MPPSSCAPSTSPGSLKRSSVQNAGSRQGERGSRHAGTHRRGGWESGRYRKANTPVPIVAKQAQLCPRIKSNAKSRQRSSTGGKDTACKGISVCSHLGEMVAVLSVQGPQQITLCKHRNSLPHLKSSFLTTKAANSWKERSSTPSARGKVLPKLALRSDKFARRPDSRSGSPCSQARQERLELPSCLSSSAFTKNGREKLHVTP